MSLEFSDFSKPNFLIDTSHDEVKLSDVWKRLLEFLNKEGDEPSSYVMNSNRSSQNFGTINAKADLNSSVADNFYSQIYFDMQKSIAAVPCIELPMNIDIDSNILEYWENYFWNETVSILMLNYYFVLDAAGAEQYEGDALFINDDGTIDIKHSHGLIKIKNKNIRMRVFDIMSADAGHSFKNNSELWEYVNYEENGQTIKLRKLKQNSLWVIPWYNIDGKTYYTVRGDDLKLSVMSQGEENDNLIKNRGKYFLDFTRRYNIEENKWMRLLMPQYKRKVEVEDLNRNFWVIAQTISAMMAYIFDPDGPYPKLIGNILNEIMQLWENILFMWSEIAIYTKKWPDTVVKVVYISPGNLSDYLSYDNFDLYDIENNNSYIEHLIIDNIIGRMDRNEEFENVIIKYLGEYRKKFANKNVVFIPVVRLSNYEKNYYKRIICPGIYRFFINYKDFSNMIEEEGLSYPDGELIDNVFRTDTEMLNGLNPILLNCYKESFQAITEIMNEHNVYKYDLGMTGLVKVIAGICEKADETGFLAINKLEKSEELKTSSQEKVYGVVKPIIFVESQKTLQYCGAEEINFYIEAYDLAKYYMETSNKIENDLISIGEKDFIVYRDWYKEYDGSYDLAEKDKIDLRRDEKAISSSVIKFKNNIIGNIGYYLGELLSEKRNSSQLNFNLITLKEKVLQPTDLDEDMYKSLYGRSINNNIQIKQDEEDDKVSLINVLKNTYDKWTMQDSRNSFWDTRKTVLNNIPNSYEWDENQKIRVGYHIERNDNNQIINSTPVEETRYSVKKSNGKFNENNYYWGDPTSHQQDEHWTERWREDAWNAIDTLNNNEMTEATILFVSGLRDTNWIDDNREGRDGGDMIAKDGLLHHIYNTVSANRISVGAAVRIPVSDSDAAYGVYPIHTSPTSPDAEWTPWGTTSGISQIWRQNYLDNGERKSIPNSKTIKDNEGNDIEYNASSGDNTNKDFYLHYREKELFIEDQNTNELISRFNLTNSATIEGQSLYTILRKKEDGIFTEDNWLIEEAKEKITSNALYYEYEYENVKTKRNLIKSFSELQNVHIAKVNGELKETGILNNVCDIIPCLNEYYKHIYQKHVNYIFNEVWSRDEKATATLANCYDKLNLRQKLFGWIRIINASNLNEIQTICFGYSNPFVYNEASENIIEIIDKKLRTEETIAGRFDANGEKTLNSSLELSELSSILIAFGHPINEAILKNCIYYGSFVNLYDTSAHTDVKSEDNYYEDRIMSSEYGIEQINQLDIIYKEQTGAAKIAFLKMVQNQFNMHPEKWYDNDIVMTYKKIAKWITPQENDGINNDGITFTFLNNSNYAGQSIFIKDNFCLVGRFCDEINLYIFGPEKVYARRGITRYPYNVSIETAGLSQEEIDKRRNVYQEIMSMGEEYFGKWPSRPLDRTINNTNWIDDYEITGADIDQLRDGYEIVSTTIKDYNYEKYKTRGSKKFEEKYCQEYGILNLGEDDFDFNSVWEND